MTQTPTQVFAHLYTDTQGHAPAPWQAQATHNHMHTDPPTDTRRTQRPRHAGTVRYGSGDGVAL